MTDHFTLLDQPRRPWLEAGPLKEIFLQRSAAVHPDRVHGAPEAERQAANACYVEINAAYQCLREPRDRLLHLLELELGAKPRAIDRAPAEAMDLFWQMGQTFRGVDAFLDERERTSSPLLHAQLFARGMEFTDRLTALQSTLNGQRDRLHEELRALNAAWEMAPPVDDARRASALPLERLEQIYRLVSYLTRWSGQIQERLVRLTL